MLKAGTIIGNSAAGKAVAGPYSEEFEAACRPTVQQAMAARLPPILEAARAAGVLVVFVRNVYSTEQNFYLSDAWLEQASRNSIFLAALCANALDSKPPLGIFRRFVVDRDGEHRRELDLKKLPLGSETIEETYCLRRWPKEQPSVEQLDWIHRVLIHCAANGAAMVDAPLRTTDGATFVKSDGFVWQLSHWLPGQANY